MKRIFFSALLIVEWLALNGCQVVDHIKTPPLPPNREEHARALHPSAGVARAAGTPLVALIPGLNAVGGRVDHEQFGRLIPLLEKEGFPACVIPYDGKKNSGQLAFMTEQILSLLETAVLEENEIRKKQNVPPLREVVFVSFSQGGPIGMDAFLELSSRKRTLFTDIHFRCFSLAGSFFGSPDAELAHDLIEIAPPPIPQIIVGRVEEQILNNRVGARAHLNLAKNILKLKREMPQLVAPQNFYFAIGAHGRHGDGFVPQSSAHLSEHFYTQMSLANLQGPPDTQRLPHFRGVGLPVYHLPGQRLFHRNVGIAVIENKKNPVYPFLIAFLKKDFTSLNKLQRERGRPLVQFMVVVYLPMSGELDKSRFKLEPQSKSIQLESRFFDKSSRAAVWTGYFKGGGSRLKEGAAAQLLISTKGVNIASIPLRLLPGKNHLLEITED